MGPACGKLRPQQARDLAGEPVVGEQEVVLEILAGRKRGHLGGERGHLVQERVLVQTSAGGQVDHTGERGEGLLRRIVR